MHIYTFDDEVYALRDAIYEAAVEGNDQEIVLLKDTLDTLENDHSKLKKLFTQFHSIGMYHF
jgi:hypothetical protein